MKNGLKMIEIGKKYLFIHKDMNYWHINRLKEHSYRIATISSLASVKTDSGIRLLFSEEDFDVAIPENLLHPIGKLGHLLYV